MNQDKISKPRWELRFKSFGKAYTLLGEAVQTAQNREMSLLEKEGVIQRFEYTWELAWKTLKDYLQSQGTQLESITPRTTLREAFKANLIKGGDIWMQALDTRNQMAHTYSIKIFEESIKLILTEYYQLFTELYSSFKKRISS